MGKLSGAIKGLVIANVIVYIIAYFAPDMKQSMFNWFALYFPENDLFKPWQLLTHMFMHGGLMHILFNMYGLWAFGSPLEYHWGRNRFLFFYFAAGIGAGIIYLAVNYFQFNAIYSQLTELLPPEEVERVLTQGIITVPGISADKMNELFSILHFPAVGASGAIYGILVAFGLSYPNAKLSLIFFPVPIAAKYFIPILIGIDLFSGLTGFSIFGGSIAHFAHIGGALVGFLIMIYWRKQNVKKH